MAKLIDMTGWRMSEHGVPNSRITVIGRSEDFIKKMESMKRRGFANVTVEVLHLFLSDII